MSRASTSLRADVEQPLRALLSYCQRDDWAGFDPYDALNSAVFGATPLSKSRLCRIAFTQLLKRCPFNLRPLLRISKEQNPKAVALFLMASIRLFRLGGWCTGRQLEYLAGRLIALRSPGLSPWCWGYSFPWQTRTVLVPREAPNLVCTTFAAGALLDLYELTGDTQHLSMAMSAAGYLLDDLYWSKGHSVAGFSYPAPDARHQVHNANFLASALLCRVSMISGNPRFLKPALTAARYSASAQASDGSWPYGESTSQGWVDNFHTGYNLCALHAIGRYAGTEEFEESIRLGFTFYREHFFEANGKPRYFSNRTYPIDTHSVAQSIITLLTLGKPADDSAALCNSVFAWAMSHLWDERGYFYYQVLRIGTNRTSYMRWSQAWMLLALATLLEHDPFMDERQASLGNRLVTEWVHR
jgi:hypothetical protein